MTVEQIVNSERTQARKIANVLFALGVRLNHIHPDPNLSLEEASGIIVMNGTQFYSVILAQLSLLQESEVPISKKVLHEIEG